MRTPSERIKSLLQMFDSFCVTVIRNFSGNLKRAAENRRKQDGTGEEPVEYLIELLSYTYCSNMAKSGMYPKMLQYLMGHSDIGCLLYTSCKIRNYYRFQLFKFNNQFMKVRKFRMKNINLKDYEEIRRVAQLYVCLLYTSRCV